MMLRLSEASEVFHTAADSPCLLQQLVGKYIIICDSDRSISYEPAGGGKDIFPSTDEDLALSKAELCKKYCQSGWVKAYGIHNCRQEFKNKTPIP